MRGVQLGLCVCLLGDICLFMAANVACGQAETRTSEPFVETDEERTERVRAERFLTVLKQRPRLGTALDRVYGYHVGRGSLDDFCKSLEEEATSQQDGKLWLVLGMVRMQRGQDALAAAAFERAETLLPAESLASYYLGKSLVMLGEVDSATAAMRRAIERKPARADMLAIFRDLGAIYQRTGRHQAALEVLNQLELIFPGDEQVQEEIASMLATEGAIEAALTRFEALANSLKDPFRRVEMAVRAGQLKAELGRTDEALADFEGQLARVNPDSWLYRDVRRRIEEVFWSSSDMDGLNAYYRKWIESHPDDFDAMMRAARVLSAQRRMPEAEEWYRKAIAIAPSRAEPRLALVESLATEGDYGQAAKEMEGLIELEPDNPDYVVRHGELVFNDADRTEEQRKAEAAEIWRRLLRKRGNDPVSVSRVADLFRGIELRDEAISHYRQAIELAPNDPQYREYLGEYLHQLGRKDEALAAWCELASGERRTRDNLVRLSEVLSTFHYPEAALEVMTEACELNPTFGHRARYAELLREAAKYDEALAQLDRAEPLAEDPELRETVLEERVKIYQASDTLAQRIEQAEDAVAGDRAQVAEAWRLLAILRDADRKLQPACEAIERATELDAGNARIWETAAALQERAGRFGDAISAYRKLATIDRRYLSNYLTQIASLEMRLGNTDGALKAGEELVASAPGNAEHHRFFAELCFRAGQADRGFDVLRRSVRGNPNDADSLTYLAQLLAQEFHTDEAIELYWRAFDLADDLEGKTAVITPLTELYLRTNRFESLLSRLETTGREQNKPREGLLWTAAAHQASGDLGTARETLEQLARDDSRDTKLLEQLVSLSRAEFEFERAAEYQKRLVAIAPTPEGEFQLANILIELGEVDQAQTLWLKLSQRKNDPAALIRSLATLIDKGELETAVAIIGKALATRADDWELLGQAMIVYARLDRKAEARRIAERVLAMNVDPGEPTAQVKATLARRSLRGSASQNQSDPYAGVSDSQRLMQAAMQLKSILVPGADDRYYMSGRRSFTPSCFREVQAIAYATLLVAADEEVNEAAFINEFTRQALASGERRQLWQAVFYIVWGNPGGLYGESNSGAMKECLTALVEQGDSGAAEMLTSLVINSRRRNAGRPGGTLEPLTAEELDQLTAWSDLAHAANPNRSSSYMDLMITVELSRAGRHEQAEVLIDRFIAGTRNSPNRNTALLQAMSVVTSDALNSDPAPQLVSKSRQLFTSALQDMQPSSPTGSVNGAMFVRFTETLVEHRELNEALDTVHEVLQWQAAQSAAMRPSQRDRLSSAGGPLHYRWVVGGRLEEVTITFPPASGYFGVETIYLLYGLHKACSADAEKLQAVTAQIARWADEPTDDPYLKFVRLMAKASFAFWSDNHQVAEAVLAEARELKLGGTLVELARTRLLYDSGKLQDALAVVEQLRPTNQQMLVDRELTILQLVLQLGDLDRARQSAQKLFALRLDSDTELKLADLMYQLGMQDLADRMMSRIRRRAGGRHETLVQLMNRYAQSSDPAAVEIARQVIRRTSPRGSQRYFTQDNQQHQQALQVMARMGELDPLIEQYERFVERSPKNTRWVDMLAACYEAAGRRDDAQRLRLQAAESAPDDPQSLITAGTQLAQLQKHDEAVEKFVAAIGKSPDVLNQHYHEMRSSFQAEKAWGRMVDALTERGIGNLSQSYQLGEIASELVQQKDHAAINRLLTAALTDLPLSGLSQMFAQINRAKLELDEKTIKLIDEKLTDDDASFAGFDPSTYSWSHSSHGRTRGFADGLAAIVTSDEELSQRVAAAMKRRIARDEDELFARVLLGHLLAKSEDVNEIREVVQPLIAKENKTIDDALAIWSVASTLTHDAQRPELACELLESVGDDSLWEQYVHGSFQFSPTALLAYSYEKAGRPRDARRILIDAVQSLEIDQRQSQYNPGYGEYQYLWSLKELAEHLLQMDYPLEAYLAYRKAYADESLLKKADAWGGSLGQQGETLARQIASKTKQHTLLPVLTAAVGGSAEAASDDYVVEIAKYLTNPQVTGHSLVDTRVTIPLEEIMSQFRGDEALAEPVSAWLRETPLPADPTSLPLRALVSRLVISDAVEDPDEVAATLAAIDRWAQAHPADAAVDSAPNDTHQPPEDARKATKASDKTAPTKSLPDELLLGIVVQRAFDAERAEQIVPLIERVIVLAEADRDEALATSLRCQLAKHVGHRDPDRARTILIETLDAILPRRNGDE